MVENVKELLSLANKANNLELYEQIVVLQTEIMSILEENRDLKDENRSARQQLALRESVVFDGASGDYFRSKDSTRDGLFSSQYSRWKRRTAESRRPVKVPEVQIAGV